MREQEPQTQKATEQITIRAILEQGKDLSWPVSRVQALSVIAELHDLNWSRLESLGNMLVSNGIVKGIVAPYKGSTIRRERRFEPEDVYIIGRVYEGLSERGLFGKKSTRAKKEAALEIVEQLKEEQKNVGNNR